MGGFEGVYLGCIAAIEGRKVVGKGLAYWSVGDCGLSGNGSRQQYERKHENFPHHGLDILACMGHQKPTCVNLDMLGFQLTSCHGGAVLDWPSVHLCSFTVDGQLGGRP